MSAKTTLGIVETMKLSTLTREFSLFSILFLLLSKTTLVSANNSNSSTLDGFGGFVALFSIGILAFMAPRLRRESIEEVK